MFLQEYKMTEEEMKEILKINKEGGDPVMYLSGGKPMGRTLQEKINDYWDHLAKKYEFKRDTVSGPGKSGPLSFIAQPIIKKEDES